MAIGLAFQIILNLFIGTKTIGKAIVSFKILNFKIYKY